MSGLMQVKYPVNNDRKDRGGRVYTADALSVKDADGNTVLNVIRHAFGGNDYEETRQNALRFTRALVKLLNNDKTKEDKDNGEQSR